MRWITSCARRASLGVVVALEKIAGQITSSTRAWLHATGFAHVGDCRELPATVDAEPGTASFEVASCKDVGVFPPVRVSTRACVILVTIGDRNQRIVRMLLVGKQDQAHGRLNGHRL